MSKFFFFAARSLSDGVRLENGQLGLRRLRNDNNNEQRIDDLQNVTGGSITTIVLPNQSYIRPKFKYSKEPRIVYSPTCFQCANFEGK